MDALEDVRGDIAFAIDPDPPVSIRDGGVLRRGFSEEVERLRAVRENAAAARCGAGAPRAGAHAA